MVDLEELKRRLTTLDAARAAVGRTLDQLRIQAHRPEAIAHPDDRPMDDLLHEFDRLTADEHEAERALAELQPADSS